MIQTITDTVTTKRIKRFSLRAHFVLLEQQFECVIQQMHMCVSERLEHLEYARKYLFN